MVRIDIAAVTKEVDVDGNLPLKIYLRSARNVLRQAEIFRNEGNQVQLYVMLLRYVSLVLKSIPRHQECYMGAFAQERQFLKQQAIKAMDELETLKPQVERLNRAGQLDMDDPFPEEKDGVVPSYFPSSPPRAGSASAAAPTALPTSFFAPLYTSASPGNNGGMDLEEWAMSVAAPSSQQQQRYNVPTSYSAPFPPSAVAPAGIPFAAPPLALSSTLPEPTAEALSRHSFFSYPSFSAPAQAQPTSGPLQVSYPTFDTSPVTIPDLLSSLNQAPAARPAAALPQPAVAGPQPPADGAAPQAGPTPSGTPGPEMVSVLLPANGAAAAVPGAAPPPLAVAAPAAAAVRPPGAAPIVSPVVQPAPPPARAEVLSIPKHASPPGHPQPPPHAVADPRPGKATKSGSGAGALAKPGGVKAIHISTKMMDEFMRLVHNNTKRNLETCGILAGTLRKGMYFITTLILPKQEATSDSCSTLNEEEIFEAQDKRGLFQLGWIHTHPTQACFMSSIDLHTHYSYQVMLPEAIAIVMAPTDSRKCGIFRLTDPGGMKVVQNCHQRGFHTHESPPDGSPIYSHSSHVFYNPKIKFDVIDIRAT